MNLLNVKSWQVLVFIICYLFFGLFYWLFLSLTYFDRADAGGQVIIGSVVRAILFIPAYWLLFERFSDSSLLKKISLHLIIGPLYAWFSYIIFHWVCSFFQVKHLAEPYANWDIFIPFVIYVLQCSIIHGYSFFSRLKVQIRKESELKSLALQAELNTLKAQIQPHFLFNTLNSIAATIPAEQEDTRELLGQLADVFRFTLHSSLQEYVTISDEIQFVQSYLSLELKRYSDKLTIKYDIDLQTEAYLMPPMLLQPLLENAIKHGVSPSLDTVTVSLKMAMKNEDIFFTVSDTGIGAGNLDKNVLLLKGNGLKNIQQRLLLQFGKGITIEDNQPRGLRFSFSIPVKKHNEKNSDY